MPSVNRAKFDKTEKFGPSAYTANESRIPKLYDWQNSQISFDFSFKYANSLCYYIILLKKL